MWAGLICATPPLKMFLKILTEIRSNTHKSTKAVPNIVSASVVSVALLPPPPPTVGHSPGTRVRAEAGRMSVITLRLGNLQPAQPSARTSAHLPTNNNTVTTIPLQCAISS